MKTAGQLLKNTRLAKTLSLREVEKATKIRLQYLQFLEKDKWEALPSLTTAKGFIRNYAQFLGLKPSNLLAIFRRDFDQTKKKKIISSKLFLPPRFLWTPRLTLALFIGLVFLLIVGYLGFQYFSLVRNPPLVVDSPSEGQIIKAAEVEVIGRADPDSLVTVNGQPVLIDSEGEFQYSLDLFEGENQIVVEAESKLGKKTAVELMVVRGDIKR